MSEDNWKHRSKGMLCGTCMWFVVKIAAESKALTSDDKKLGRCRKHSPTLNGWPSIFSSDWCGDHKIDENKI